MFTVMENTEWDQTWSLLNPVAQSTPCFPTKTHYVCSDVGTSYWSLATINKVSIHLNLFQGLWRITSFTDIEKDSAIFRNHQPNLIGKRNYFACYANCTIQYKHVKIRHTVVTLALQSLYGNHSISWSRCSPLANLC